MCVCLRACVYVHDHVCARVCICVFVCIEAVFFHVRLLSVFVSPVNVTIHRGQVSIVLTVLKREALRSGKIKIVCVCGERKERERV